MNETAESVLHPRFKQLDSLRGVAAICVLLCHFQLIFKVAVPWIGYLKISPLGFFFNGRSSVMFFFVLSGFVLSLPFINNEKPLKLTEFYIKRFFRIYPAYVFALIFSLILKKYFYDRGGMQPFSDWVTTFWRWDWNHESFIELVKSIILVGPKFDDRYFNPVIWSLVVEMQMSLILPFFIIIATRTNFLFNGLFFFVIAWIVYYNQSHYLGIFYVGVICAKFKDKIIEKVKYLKKSILALLILTGILMYNIHFETENYYNSNFQFFIKDYISACGGLIFLIVAVSRTRIAIFFKNRFFTFVGEISYSFYLLHLPILITLCSIFSERYKFSNIYILVLEITLTFIVSKLTFLYIERPFQRFGGRLTKKINRSKFEQISL